MTDESKTPDSFAAEMNDKALHCRELGHNWRSWTVSYDTSARAYDRRLRCPSCRTVRKQLLDSTGHVVSNSYIYPDGYLAKGVAVGLTRDVFRLEAIHRFLGSTDAPQLRAV